MKKQITLVATYLGTILCLSVQAYLAVLLFSTSSALAQTEAAPAPAKIEAPAKPEPPAPPVAPAKEKSFKFKVGDSKIKFKDGKLEIKTEEDKFNNIDIGDAKIDVAEIIRAANSSRRDKSFTSELEDIIVPVVLFLCIAGMLYMRYSFQHKYKKEQIEVIRMMVEKGQPVPEHLFSNSESKVSWLDQMQRGFKYSAVGLGLTIFFYSVSGPWALGTIPLFVGVGYIISSQVRKKYEQK